MDRIAYVTKVYDKISEKFCADIPSEEKQIIKEKYLEYLHKAYDQYFEKADKESLSQEALFCVKKESIINLKRSYKEKRAWLFPDEQYLKLEALSLELGSYAKGKKRPQELSKTREEYLTELDSLYKKVSEEFKFSAERMYSEAVLDLENIFGDTNIFSIRNAVYKNN